MGVLYNSIPTRPDMPNILLLHAIIPDVGTKVRLKTNQANFTKSPYVEKYSYSSVTVVDLFPILYPAKLPNETSAHFVTDFLIIGTVSRFLFSLWIVWELYYQSLLFTWFNIIKLNIEYNTFKKIIQIFMSEFKDRFYFIKWDSYSLSANKARYARSFLEGKNKNEITRQITGVSNTACEVRKLNRQWASRVCRRWPTASVV